ncbi:hypothetical protein L6164_013889 [Bauhinia variegata]|uniref:Uncharacterized protein n=1 Tax=Bauhinia variegata TaxID=167791 RepID=A0ACB9NH07_BAUVA|nr:hypothetical protein L6164_013889 [Bauhinia variegata]
MALAEIALILCGLAAINNQIAVARASIDIGVNYGRQGNDLPSPDNVIQMYKKYGIGKMRLFKPEPSVLQALRGSQIDLVLGIANEDLPNLAASLDATHSWFATNVEPYLNDIQFTFIVAGNEVVPGNLAQFVLPVMQNMQNILTGKGLAAVKVSTSVAVSTLGQSYPPSQGAFSEDSKETMQGILKFLAAQGTPLLINAYPYLAYTSDPQDISLDYALFTANGPIVHDGNLSYSNLFDAMVDGFFSAMEQLGISNVGVVVSESGWPSAGNGNFTTPELAATYNRNFMKHILSGDGTPKRPGSYIEGFVFAMFNENQKPAGVEQNWGLFYPDMQPVYQVFPLQG